MRLVNKYQFYCNSVDRVQGTTGDFSLNLPFQFPVESDIYSKIYLQQYVIRYDKPPITSDNSAFEVDTGGGFVTRNISEGFPSVLDIQRYLQQTLSLAGFYDAPKGKFYFTGTISLRFPATGSCAKALGFVAGNTYTNTSGSTLYSPNVVAISTTSTIDVSCTFGDQRYTTAGGKLSQTTLCASAPVLVPYLGNVAYTDVLGTNGMLIQSSRQQLDSLRVKVSDNDRNDVVPILDWSFIIAVELWKDDTDANLKLLQDIKGLMSGVQDTLQVQTVGQGMASGALQGEQQPVGDTNAPDGVELSNNLSLYPGPPIEMDGLLPAGVPMDVFAMGGLERFLEMPPAKKPRTE